MPLRAKAAQVADSTAAIGSAAGEWPVMPVAASVSKTNGRSSSMD